MGKINRRSALAVTGAGLTAALAGVQSSVAAAGKDPWSRAYELGEELSRIVSDLASNQTLMVKVYPKEAPGVEGEPVRFCRVDRVDLGELRGLIETHYKAMEEYELCPDKEWDDRKEAIDAKINASREALLVHQPKSLAEVRMKASFMANDKAFGRWDDIEAQRIIRSLIPT